jgi:MFS family permease
MIIFLVLTFLMHIGQAVVGPAWVSWMADLVPARVRGKYFSRRRQWGILSAIPAAFFAGWMLDRPEIRQGGVTSTLVTLNWCALLFLCAAVFGVADIALFQFIDDIPAKPRRHVPWKKVFAEPLRNREFLWFGGFVAVLKFDVSFMGQFVSLYLIEKLKITNKSTQLMLLVGPMTAQLAMLPVWGHAVDRVGKKPVLAISALGLVPIGFGWCFMNGGGAGSIWLGYFLAAAGAALWAGVEVANFNLVLEFSGSTTDDGEAGGSNYVAVNSVIINIAGCFGGLASGVIAKAMGDWSWRPPVTWLGTFSFYEVLFAISGVLRLLAVVIFLPKIHEPEARPTVEALRFMTANIYNNLFNAVFLPLRVMGIETESMKDEG